MLPPVTWASLPLPGPLVSQEVGQVDFSPSKSIGSTRLVSTRHSIHGSTEAPPLSTGLFLGLGFSPSRQLEGRLYLPSGGFSPRFSQLRPHPHSHNLAPHLGFLTGTFVNLWIRTGSCWHLSQANTNSPARVLRNPDPTDDTGQVSYCMGLVMPAHHWWFCQKSSCSKTA